MTANPATTALPPPPAIEALLGSVDFVWSIDVELRFTYLSEGFERVTGYTVASAIGRAPRELPWFRASAEALRFRDHLAQSRQPLRELRFDLVHRDGSARLLSINASPRFGADGSFAGYAGVAIDVTEARRADQVLDSIAQAVGRASNDSYFATLAGALVETLDADLAFIGRQIPGRGAVEAIAAHGRAGPLPDFAYELEGAPCANVVGKQPCVYPAEAWRLFPRDRTLADDRMEAYCGVPLFDSQGRPLGLIAVIRKAPLIDADLARNVLQVMAERAAAELERQAANAALRQSEARHRDLFNAAPTMLIALDQDERVTAVSDEWLRFTGYSREEVIGSQRGDFLSPAAADRLRQIILPRLAVEGELSGIEIQLPRKDGTVADVRLSMRQRRDPLTGAVQILSVVEDIAAQKLAERALSEKQQQLDSILDHAPVGIFLKDRSGRYVRMNRQALEWRARRREDVEGSRTADFVSGALAKAAEDSDRAVLERGEIVEFEMPTGSSRPEYQHAAVTKFPVRDSGGAIIGVGGILTNVTARHEAEAALAQSRQYLLQSQRLGRTGYIVSDHATGRVTWSESMFEIRGVEPRPWFSFEEAVGFIHPDDRARFLAVRNEAVANRRPFQLELRVVRPDGAIIWEHSIGHPLFDADGRLSQLLVFVQDVTERHRAEEALRESQKYLLEAQRVGRIGHWVSDDRTRQSRWSPQLFEIMGLSATDAVTLERLTRGQDPEDIARYAAFRQRAGELRQRVAGEFRWRRPDGQVRWLHTEIEPRLGADGSIEGYFGVSQDITEQRQAETENRKLALVAAHTSSLVFITDPAHRIEWVNDAFARTTGYTLADASGQTPRSLLAAPDADPNWTSFVRSRLESGEGFRDFEAHCRSRDGREFWLSLEGVPVRDAAGTIIQYIGIGTDVTAQRLAEEENRKLALVAARTTSLVYVTDADHRIEWVNDALMRITGYGPEEARGRLPRDVLMGPNPDPAVVAYTRRQLGAGQGFRDYEFLCRTKQGRPYWISLEVQPVRDADGRVVQFIGVGTDVTAQKQAQLQLEESRALLLESQRIGKLGYAVSDMAADRVTWSDSVFEMYGLPRQAHLSIDESTARILPEDRLRFRAARDAGIAARQAFAVEVRVRHSSGGVRWQHCSGHPRFDADGNYTGLMMVVQDITERKLAEEALAEKERELRAILDNAPIAIFLKDREGRYRLVNRCFQGWFERLPDSVLGLTDQELAPADVAAVAANTDREVLERGEPVQYERHAYGTQAPGLGVQRLLVTKFPLRDASGAVVGIAGFLLDITARKQAEDALRTSEERFRALIEHSNDLVAVIGLDGKIRYQSPSVPERLGYGQEEFLGRSILDLVHADDAGGIAAALARISQTPGAEEFGEGRVRHKDGSWRYIAYTARNAANVPGVEGIIVNGRDVTEAKRLEEQLLQAQKMEAVGQLAGGIAHDFNNIIGAMLGFADFLVQDLPPNSPTAGFAQRIVKAGERARDLVQQILAFSRRSGVERRPEDIGKVVLETADLLRGSLPSSTALEIEAREGAAVALVNAGQIGQVLLNLCLNANDALQGEPGRITVSVETNGSVPALAADSVQIGNIETGREYVRVAVRDTGAGIAPDLLRKVFDPFFTTKERGRGTGLGLAVVHGIVTTHGGACRVTSRPGAGTTFDLLLPRLASRSTAGAPAAVGRDVRGSERVLIVDDEVDLTDMLALGLDRLGYDTMGCNDPLEALEAFAADPAAWDVVISDQVMPHLKGMTLFERLKALKPGIRFILCTGFSDGATEESALQCGIDAYFVKPVATERLAAAIRDMMDRPAA